MQKQPPAFRRGNQPGSPHAKGDRPAHALPPEAKAWLKENRPALEAYNEHIEKHGVFSERLRSF